MSIISILDKMYLLEKKTNKKNWFLCILNSNNCTFWGSQKNYVKIIEIEIT